MVNPTYTFSIFGRYEVGINKFMLPIKMSLFCFFAGSRTTSAFIPVYLKHQGLTITHLSVMMTIGVAFQFIAAMISGMIADRIGRVKPFLFMYGSIFLATLVCFTVMPKIDKCDGKNIYFYCVDERLAAQDSCHISQKGYHKETCSLIYGENSTQYDENENCPFVSLLLKRDFNFEHYHKNETSSLCLYQVNFKNNSSKDTPPCEIQNCTSFHMVCSKKGTSDCLKNRSFWILIYGILVVLCNTSQTNVYRFFDVIVMDLSNKYNSEFGRQRLWSVLGLSVGPSLAGFISDHVASNGSDKSYAPVFICAAIFAALAFIPVLKINPKFHKPAPMVWKKSLKFVINLETILFFILLLTMGISLGFLVIYGNWYLQDLGASDLLLGVSIGVSAICGLPFLYISKWIFNKVGLRNFFVICLLSCSVYAFGFSVMRDPWVSVGINLLNVVAYQLFWVASIEYCDEVAPVELQATMKVLAGSLHYNIARLGATAIGGYIMKNFGGRMAYRVIGSLAVCYAIIYGIYLISQRKKTGIRKKKSGVQADCDDCEKEMCMK